jgi:hypothetical protein
LGTKRKEKKLRKRKTILGKWKNNIGKIKLIKEKKERLLYYGNFFRFGKGIYRFGDIPIWRYTAMI